MACGKRTGRRVCMETGKTREEKEKGRKRRRRRWKERAEKEVKEEATERIACVWEKRHREEESMETGKASKGRELEGRGGGGRREMRKQKSGEGNME